MSFGEATYWVEAIEKPYRRPGGIDLMALFQSVDLETLRQYITVSRAIRAAIRQNRGTK